MSMEVVLAVIVFSRFSPSMLMMMQINLPVSHFTSLVYRLLGPYILFTWMHVSFEFHYTFLYKPRGFSSLPINSVVVFEKERNKS